MMFCLNSHKFEIWAPLVPIGDGVDLHIRDRKIGRERERESDRQRDIFKQNQNSCQDHTCTHTQRYITNEARSLARDAVGDITKLNINGTSRRPAEMNGYIDSTSNEKP